MSPPKIFVTGSTGYIGGDALDNIIAAHPDYEITCLVRNSDKGALVASKFAKVRLVYGDLDSVELLEEESSKADVVLHFANADHETGAKAIAAGLAKRQGPNPAYWIHTSGAAILGYPDIERKSFGIASDKTFNDWDGIDELFQLPDFAPHRGIDKIVQDAGVTKAGNVRTAIVCPPLIYGQGNGPGNQQSVQIPLLTNLIIDRGHGVIVGEGATKWTNVHVHDLSKVYLLLLEDALKEGGGSEEAWSSKGYFFATNGQCVWKDNCQLIVKECKKQGLIESDEIESLDSDTANKLVPFGHILWGLNSRGLAVRAKKVLGWTPVEESLESAISKDVDAEIRNRKKKQQ